MKFLAPKNVAYANVPLPCFINPEAVSLAPQIGIGHHSTFPYEWWLGNYNNTKGRGKNE